MIPAVSVLNLLSPKDMGIKLCLCESFISSVEKIPFRTYHNYSSFPSVYSTSFIAFLQGSFLQWAIYFLIVFV